MTTATDSLAINGGPKTRTAPWPPRRLFGEAEKQAAVALFDRAIEQGEAFGYNGPEEDGYCKEFVEYQGGKGYADLVNSGTTAVYVALRALGIEPFSEVIVPCITDMGGCMPAALLGAIPVPADCAPGSYNIGAEQIAARITDRTSAIVVAHISGLPVDMDPVMALARKHNLPVVEDCAQCHGAIYKGRKVGTIGDVAAFSTMFGKHHATSGQGGVVYTRREDLYWKIRRAADRGKPFGIENPVGNVIASLNFNQDEMGAAIGRVQLAKLESIIEGKRRVALGLADGCKKKSKAVRVVGDPQDGRNVFWFIWGELVLDKLTVDKETFIDALAAEGVPVSASYIFAMPHENPWYKDRAVFGTSGWPWTSPQYKGDADAVWEVPNIRATDKYVFRFNLHEGFTDADVVDIVAGIEKVERAYLK
jgi:dTDP-4-amino-4,6-dideoxygalactose transaminase